MTDPVVWTWPAAGDIAERLEWLTDAMPAATGPRQHRRLRIAPRIYPVFDTLVSGADRRWLENAVAANGSGDWLVPLVQDGSYLVTPWPAGSLSLVMDADTTLRRFTDGGKVLLINDDARTYDVCEVVALTESTIEVAALPDHDWAAGTRVVPLVTGKLATVPDFSRFTGDDVPLQMTFRLTEPLDWTPDAGPATYRDYPVLELLPDWSSEPAYSPDRATMTVDEGTGPVSVIDLPGVPLGLTTLQFSLQGRAELGAFLALLYALAGRWSPLWLPSHAQDLLVTGALVSASTQLDVEWSGLSEFDLAPNRRDIRIELRNGIILYRRIASVSAISLSTERLVLDSALGVTATAADVSLVSFLAFACQDTDVNLLRYWSDELVVSDLRLRGVLDHDV